MLDEVHACWTYLEGMDYHAVMNMPTYQRRYFLVKKQNELTDSEEKQGNGASKSGGNGNRSTTISGNALKSHLKTNGNPS